MMFSGSGLQVLHEKDEFDSQPVSLYISVGIVIFVVPICNNAYCYIL